MQPRFNVYKRLSIAILATLIPTILFIGNASAASNSFRDSLKSYINRTGDLRLSNQTYNNLELDDNNPNLYLTIYNETINTVDDQVYQGMAQITNYSAANLKSFVENGNTNFLLKELNFRNETSRNPNSLAWKAEQLSGLYAQQKEFFTTLANLENKTIAMEIFSNGDKSDAGFDLLDDLTKIEKILYDEVGDSSFGPSINLNGGFLARASGVPVTSPLQTQIANGSTINSSGGASSNSLETLFNKPTTVSQSNNIDSAFCPIDPSLQQSLTDYVNSESSNAQNSNPITLPNNNGTTQPNPNTLSKTLVGTLNDNPVIGFSNSQRQCPNNATFCFRTELIYNTAESYFAEDRQCLACEVARMSQATQAIVDGNLIAKKATGNFLEPNVCKRVAFDRLFSFRVNILTRPILPADDTVEQVNSLSPQQIEKDIIETRAKDSPDSGFGAGTTASTVASSGRLADIVDAQAVNKNFEDENAYTRLLIPNIGQNLETLSNITGGLSARIESFANYLVSINELAVEMNQTLASIKSKPTCR